MSLFLLFTKTRLNPGKAEDVKTLERWMVALSRVPNDVELIDRCFEPLYDMKFMPQPSDFLKIQASKRIIGAERQITQSKEKSGKVPPFAKELCGLVFGGVIKAEGCLGYFEKVKEIYRRYGMGSHIPEIDRLIVDAREKEERLCVTNKKTITVLEGRVENIDGHLRYLHTVKKEILGRVKTLRQLSENTNPHPQEAR